MKKLVIVFVILFLSVFYFVGCDSTTLNFNSITFLDSEIFVTKNDHLNLFDLKFKTEPMVDKVEYFDFGIDEKYISFEDNKFYFKNVGKTILNVYAMGVNNEVISSNIKINIVDNLEVTKFEPIEGVVYLDCGENYALKNNIAIKPLNIADEVKFSCDDITKITDDEIFCSDVAGEFLVYASVRKAINDDELECVSYKIIVQNNVYVEDVKLNNLGTFKVYENSEGFINFGIVPMNANVFEIKSNSENLSISKDGKFVAKSAMDNIELTVQYKTDKLSEIKTKSFRVDIIENASLNGFTLYDKENNKIQSVVADEDVVVRLELKITNMQTLNKAEFSEVFNVFDVEYKNSLLKADVSFKNAKDDRKVELKYIDGFGNINKLSIDLNDIRVFSKDEIKLVAIGNANELEFDENTGEYLLFIIEDEFYSDANNLVNYSLKIELFENNNLVNLSSVIAEDFTLENDWLYAKELGSFNIKVLAYGCEFEIKVKVSEVPILDFDVIGWSGELLLNSENAFKTRFEIESAQYYSRLLKNIEVSCDIENSLEIDLNNKTISIKDVKSDKCYIKFKIGSITKEIEIKTGYALTDVKVSIDGVGLMKDNVVSNFKVSEHIFYSLNFYSKSTLLLNDEFDVKIIILNEDMSVSEDIYISAYSSSGLNYFSISKVGKYFLKICFNDELNYKLYEIKVDWSAVA